MVVSLETSYSPDSVFVLEASMVTTSNKVLSPIFWEQVNMCIVSFGLRKRLVVWASLTGFRSRHCSCPCHHSKFNDQETQVSVQTNYYIFLQANWTWELGEQHGHKCSTLTGKISASKSKMLHDRWAGCTSQTITSSVDTLSWLRSVVHCPCTSSSCSMCSSDNGPSCTDVSTAVLECAIQNNWNYRAAQKLFHESSAWFLHLTSTCKIKYVPLLLECIFGHSVSVSNLS